MKILIACEYSGIVRDAFLRKGHDVISCDVLDTESLGPHYKGDVRDILYEGWDMMIAHPPCTHLSVSGARWFSESAGKHQKPIHLREEALDFVRTLLNAPIDRICLENPVSVISSHIRKSDQCIQPWQFGHPENKKTCLWLKNLPKLQPTNNVSEEMMNLSIQERNKVWYMGSGKGKERSRFFEGIAEGMADQWNFKG